MSFIKTPSQRTLSVIGILILALALLKVIIPRPDIRKQIEDLRTEAAPKFDSLYNQMAAEKRFFDSIQYLIRSGRLAAADNVIDQLLKQQPRNDRYLTLKGQTFDARGLYDSAIYYYNSALMIYSSSGAGIEKAKTLVKIKHYPEAIQEYRKAYEVNYDFSYPLARVFELNKQKDSALKYYNIYLEHYPDSLFQTLKQRGIYVYPPDSVKLKISNLNK